MSFEKLFILVDHHHRQCVLVSNIEQTVHRPDKFVFLRLLRFGPLVLAFLATLPNYSKVVPLLRRIVAPFPFSYFNTYYLLFQMPT